MALLRQQSRSMLPGSTRNRNRKGNNITSLYAQFQKQLLVLEATQGSLTRVEDLSSTNSHLQVRFEGYCVLASRFFVLIKE